MAANILVEDYALPKTSGTCHTIALLDRGELEIGLHRPFGSDGSFAPVFWFGGRS